MNRTAQIKSYWLAFIIACDQVSEDSFAIHMFPKAIFYYIVVLTKMVNKPTIILNQHLLLQ